MNKLVRSTPRRKPEDQGAVCTNTKPRRLIFLIKCVQNEELLVELMQILILAEIKESLREKEMF